MRRLVTLRAGTARSKKSGGPAGAQARKAREARAQQATAEGSRIGRLAAERITAAALAVGRDGDALGEELTEEQVAAISERIDPQAAPVAGVVSGLLPGAGPVQKETGVSAKELDGILLQRTEAISLHRSSMRYLARTQSCERAVAETLRESLWGLILRTRKEAGDRGLLRDERETLASDAEELLGVADREEALEKSQRDRSRRRGQADAALREAQRQKGTMLRAILDLRRGGDVDDDTLDEAATTYAVLHADAEASEAASAPARRTRRTTRRGPDKSGKRPG